MTGSLIDAQDRERAVITFDQNIVVTAGAGTGKTTLLVNRLVHLLMREPNPVEITEIVALTFTNKAAGEMKVRLRQKLESFLNCRLSKTAETEKEGGTQSEVQEVMNRYRLTKDQLNDRTREALRHLERSNIGTIHSFAATLLRLYPLEAGVDPKFQEDDGTRFEEEFNTVWADWLETESNSEAPRKQLWKEILSRFSVDQVRELALALCPETVPLEQIKRISNRKGIPKPVSDWLKTLSKTAKALMDQHLGEKKIGRCTRAAGMIISEYLAHFRIRPGVLEEEKEFILSAGTLAGVKGWNDTEVEEAKRLVRVAERLLKSDSGLIEDLGKLIIPFVESFRMKFLKEGYVSFDGLLVKARDLLRTYPSVREELKRHFKSLLIDEFQDTDPIQYEILLYLAEETGRQSKTWRDIKLSPGKIFVVGDPKQSIYAFRRADIEAYLYIVRDFIEGQNGIHCKLTTNFRSHAGILDVVNEVFKPLIHYKEGTQPHYIDIDPPSQSEKKSPPLPFRQVTLRKITTDEENLDAETARELEAEALARWLSDEVIEKAILIDSDGRQRKAQKKDVAILMRTLPNVDIYLEALRRRGIRYVVEGEKHFYSTQEVIDAVNLLLCVASPQDSVALVGVLRSAFGGLTDAQIYELSQKKLLDYQSIQGKTPFPNTGAASFVRELYEKLYRLYQEVPTLPAGEAVTQIFHEIPVMVLAAHSQNGEQGVANLDKLRRMAEEMGDQGPGTFKETLSRLKYRVQEVREEGESALAEESIDAVRILSVHRAKGLEFPIVILAGCHSEPGGKTRNTIQVSHDWFSDLIGIRMDEYWDLPAIFLAEKTANREREEQKRVLYVAMTRAREHLMISCAQSGSSGSGFLGMIQESMGDIFEEPESKSIPAGNSAIALTVLREDPHPPRKRVSGGKPVTTKINWPRYTELWNQRYQTYRDINAKPLFITPTFLKQQESEISEGTASKRGQGHGAHQAALVGTIAHRFLEDWDFGRNPASFQDHLLPLLAQDLKPDPDLNPELIRQDLESIFETFFASEAYQELAGSRILGREVPFLSSRDGQILEGIIDLIYEKEGQIFVADYKTDHIGEADLSTAGKTYRHQAEIYSEAVRRSLQREIGGFKLIFLRIGKALQV